MEKLFPQCGKLGFRAVIGCLGLFARGCGAKRAAPHVSRNARPTEGPGKTVPDAGGQRTQPRPLRVRRSERPFFSVTRSGVSRAFRRNGGGAREAILIKGLLIIPRGLRDHAAEGRRPDPSPERVRAVGTVPGAVQSPRLAGRPPLSKWPRVSRVAGHSGRVAGGLAVPF
jgi:hypothetical protein